MSEENASSFKIKDRRMFNPDGSARESTEETDHDLSSQSPIPDLGALPSTQPTEPGPEDLEELPVFLEFLSGLVFSAQASLGLIKHPDLQGRKPDLENGRQFIDILGAVQQKTKGNLTREEERFLQLALDDLRVNFVKLSAKK